MRDFKGGFVILTQPSATAKGSTGQSNHPSSQFIVHHWFWERLCSVGFHLFMVRSHWANFERNSSGMCSESDFSRHIFWRNVDKHLLQSGSHLNLATCYQGWKNGSKFKCEQLYKDTVSYIIIPLLYKFRTHYVDFCLV